MDGIVVDVSFNQLGGLFTLNFLEEVDLAIGGDHIFKRAIILVGGRARAQSLRAMAAARAPQRQVARQPSGGVRSKGRSVQRQAALAQRAVKDLRRGQTSAGHQAIRLTRL